MFRTEQLADNVTLHCGDSREIIPALAFIGSKTPSQYAIISDPPYGIEELVGGYGRTQLAKIGQHDRRIANDKNLDCVVEVLNLIKQTFDNAWVLLFYSCRISPVFYASTSMLDHFGEIIWDKKVIGLGEQLRYRHENVGVFYLGEPSPFGDPTPKSEAAESLISCFGLKGDNRSVHPHEKPPQVMDKICRVTPGKIIVDPFMGTGSTGAAAVRKGRGFIGIEYEPKYFELALKKVSSALAQGKDNWWE